MRVRRAGAEARRVDGFLSIDLAVAPMRDPAGRIIALLASAVDITDRNRAERDQALLAAIVADTEDAVIAK